MEKIQLLFIIGSLRGASFNRQLMEIAKETLADRAEITILEYADIPYMNQDIEFPVPPQIARVRGEVDKADGIWIFSPEYNHSIPGVLKNLLDWLSRPAAEGSQSIVKGKLVTYCGAGGASGTSSAQDQLLFLLNFIGMKVATVDRAAVALSQEAFRSGELGLSENSRRFLNMQADAFLKCVEEQK